MRREVGPWRAMVNAVCVLAILALASFGVVQVARRHWQWQSTFPVRAQFATIAGIEEGSRVRVQGMDAGVVETIVPPAEPGLPVTLMLRIDERLHPLVRTDASARIVSQGVVGAKLIEIVPGSPDSPALADGGLLPTETPREVADLLADATVSLHRLNAVADAAEQGLGEINSITAQVRRGEGTLGRLVQDEEAYERLVALSERGEDALGDLEENLTALKQTWPISRYFRRRGFDDRDQVLYKPGSERESRVLPSRELFEPGRAVLTSGGRQQLDQVAHWFKQLQRPRSTEIVIAAFTESPRDEDLAQILTQEQAEAVRNYLTTRHRIQYNGLLRRDRKVAAVGFGTQTPRTPTGSPMGGPSERVEIILFTPQT